MRAENETRTRDPDLGKVVLYQLSYFRVIGMAKIWIFLICANKKDDKFAETESCMRKIVSILFCLLCCIATAYAQLYYTPGSDPIRRWRSLLTEHYEIIYPEGIDSLARVYAANMEAVRNDAIVLPQKVSPARTSVILHPYTLSGDDEKRSNTPLRLDVYTGPEMYDYMSEPWEYTTAIAKSRQLGQEYLLDRGFFNVLSYVLGDNMRLLGDNVFFNGFYRLGDEKVAVTDLSHAGVGRDADYLKVYRTSFIENDLRNYDRWKLGSYEYITPGKDAFGYILESNYRFQHDDYPFGREWADIVVAHPVTALLKGRRADAVGTFMAPQFNEARDSLAALFQRDYNSRRPFTPSTSVWPARNYTEYVYFVYMESQDAIYAIKESLQEAPQLVKIDLSAGTEKFLMFFNPNTSCITECNGILYWSETVHKGPWELLDYSEIFSYNTANGAVKRLTRNTRYFHPVPNESGTVLAVSENTPEGDSYLTILSPSGNKELSIRAPQNGSIKEMVWLGDVLYCLIVTKDGVGVYSMSDDGWNISIAPQWQNISDFSIYDMNVDGRQTKVITFVSDVDGVSNVYAYNPATGSVHQLVNSPYGAAEAQPYKDGGLIYCQYGPTGYSIVRTSADYLEMKKVDMSSPYKFPLAEKGSELASNAYPKPSEDYIAEFMDEGRYPSKRYFKPANWFNVHSWLPLYVNIGNGKSRMASIASLGAMVMSQNKLGTVSAMLGYSYGRSQYSNVRRHGFHSSLTFNGTIPRIELKAEFNTEEKMSFARYMDEFGQPAHAYLMADDGLPYYDVSVRLYQPLTYSALGFNASLLPSLSYHHNNIRAIDYINKVGCTHSDYIEAGISGSVETEPAHAAIYPRWGLGFSMDRISPAFLGEASRWFTSQLKTEVSAYLPGIWTTHGVSASMAFVRQNWKNGDAVFPITSLIDLPRGYLIKDLAQFNSRKYLKLAVDYAAPINLSDTSLGGVMYLRRLQLIPFADYAVSSQHDGGRIHYYSFGTDLLLDFNVARFKADLSAGVRGALNNGDAYMGQNATVQFLFKLGL